MTQAICLLLFIVCINCEVSMVSWMMVMAPSIVYESIILLHQSIITLDYELRYETNLTISID